MGAYLSQPNTMKCSGDGAGAPRLPLPYGFSAMQGWRVSMEVRPEGPRDRSLEGGNPVERKGAGGWGHPRGRVRIGSLSPQRQFWWGGIESGRELPMLGGRAPAATSAARALPCGEAPSDADRLLPVPSRLPLVPAPLSDW